MKKVLLALPVYAMDSDYCPGDTSAKQKFGVGNKHADPDRIK